MHRDMKVGLSLGVLLVGVVGALFFRREPEKKPAAPQLQNGSQIDQQIAERPRGPYLSHPEESVEANPATVARTSEKSAGRSNSTPAAGRTVATLTLDDEAPPPGSAMNRTPGTPHVASTVPPPLGAGNAEWETIGTPGPIAAGSHAPGSRNVPVARTTASENAPATRTHVVQAGETLSGLAGKYLGSTARFREIYDLNRDVLRSPDSMTAGLTLKIPAKSGRRATGDAHPAIAGPTPSTSTAGADGMTRPVSQQRDRLPAGDASENPVTTAPPAERPVPRFSPVRRSPFAVGRSTQPAPVTVPEAASVPATEPSADE